ncbi:hypothetical protein ACLOJK_025958 [Asimina triloba]
MAFSSSFLLLLHLLLLSLAHAQPPSFRPDALLLPVTKDAATIQYLTHLSHRTPLLPLTLVVHLAGPFLWLDCDAGYLSSSYSPPPCRSPQCSLATTTSTSTSTSTACRDCFMGPRPGCNINACTLSPHNPFARATAPGELAQDALSFPSTDGSNPGPDAAVPRFLYSCAPTFLLRGLASGAQGIAGLARSGIQFPSKIRRLPSLFGDGPYVFLPGIDVWKSLMYTPLLTNPGGELSSEYFIGVKSIKINGKQVPINTSLLAIDGNGVGGTKISTVHPYTVLETSIYRAVTEAFARETASIPRAAPVAPFDVCFSSKSMGSTRAGPAVVAIDLVLQSEGVYWRILGANSMVGVKEGVDCLAFVDGGANPRTSIVVGGHQLEDNLLQFDLGASRLGFSSSLLVRQTSCGDFNFTSNG